MYKVIFIDWQNTLSASLFWEHLKELESPYPEHFKKIQESLFIKHIDMAKDWMRGKYTTEQIVAKVAGDTNIPYEQLHKDFVFSCQTMKIEPEVLDLIQKMRKRGIKIVIATDNMDSFKRWTTDSLKLADYFDDVLNSYSLKALKGDLNEDGESLFFKDYLIKHNVKKGESALLDDSQLKAEIIEKHGIDYYQITKENTLLLQLKNLLDKE